MHKATSRFRILMARLPESTKEQAARISLCCEATRDIPLFISRKSQVYGLSELAAVIERLHLRTKVVLYVSGLEPTRNMKEFFDLEVSMKYNAPPLFQ